MVILGCDIYMSGITGVNVTTLAKMIDNRRREMAEHHSEDSLFALLHCKLMEKNNLTCNGVNTYIDTIIYNQLIPHQLSMMMGVQH
jgi:hypothetical protein